MSNLTKIKKSKLLLLCVMLLCVAMLLAACAKTPGDTDTQASESNQTAVKGILDIFDPSAGGGGSGGRQIEGSEEEELQQERIGGGAVSDAIVSENLEPLIGLTDYSKGDFVNAYGIFDDPPTMEKSHETYGADCLLCHSGGGTAAEGMTEIVQQPPGHESAKITNDDCAICHTHKE